METKRRILAFDIARALCVLYIVGFWHMTDYLYRTETIMTIRSTFPIITKATLACFTFISGYFLGKKKMGGAEFYKNRICRVYWLYLIASILYLAFGIENIQTFLCSIIGISNFVAPQPLTLWYITMLLLFYAVTPWLKNPDDIRRMAIKALIVALLFHVIAFQGMLDARVAFYFLFYVLGLVTPSQNIAKVFNNSGIFLMCSMLLGFIFYIMLSFGGNFFANYFFKVVISICGTIAILSISHLLSKLRIPYLNESLSWIAYASLCVYLFHRVVYKVVIYAISGGSGSLIFVGYVPIMIAILLVIGFFIQKLYDLCLQKVRN